MNEIKIGTVEGTGAAINVPCGFIPDRVEVLNAEDGDTLDIWYAGMAEGTSVTITSAAATRGSNGISSYAGSTTIAKGFTIGSGISESGKTLFYKAERQG